MCSPSVALLCCHGLGLAVAGVEESVVEGAEAAVAVVGFPAGAHCARVLAVGFSRLKHSRGLCVVRFAIAEEGVGGCKELQALGLGASVHGLVEYRAVACVNFFEVYAVGRAWDVVGNARVAFYVVLFLFLLVLA